MIIDDERNIRRTIGMVLNTKGITLQAASGNVSQAARLRGIDRTNLHKKIQSFKLGD